MAAHVATLHPLNDNTLKANVQAPASAVGQLQIQYHQAATGLHQGFDQRSLSLMKQVWAASTWASNSRRVFGNPCRADLIPCTRLPLFSPKSLNVGVKFRGTVSRCCQLLVILPAFSRLAGKAGMGRSTSSGSSSKAAARLVSSQPGTDVPPSSRRGSQSDHKRDDEHQGGQRTVDSKALQFADDRDEQIGEDQSRGKRHQDGPQEHSHRSSP